MDVPDLAETFDISPEEDFVLTRNPPARRWPYQELNVVVDSGFVRQSDAKTIFGADNWWDLQALKVPPTTDITTLVHQLGLFESKGQARKANFKGPIPAGYSEVRIGKTIVVIWNPNQ